MGNYETNISSVSSTSALQFIYNKLNKKDQFLIVAYHGMSSMLRVYGVGGKLLKAAQSFYLDCRACVRVEMDVSERFKVNFGLRQGCVIPPWFFNVLWMV